MPATRYDTDKLLEIARSTGAPETQPRDSDNWCANVEFQARDGWKVVIFYDCGGIDYIDHFVTPLGDIVDFWDWESEGAEALREWRG